MFIGHLYIFFYKVFVQVFDPFLLGCLSFMLSSLFLHISPLSDVCIANSFSQPMVCLFIFLIIFFHDTFLILIKSNVFSSFLPLCLPPPHPSSFFFFSHNLQNELVSIFFFSSFWKSLYKDSLLVLFYFQGSHAWK